MKAELIFKFRFSASHSLSGYEVQHPHLWNLELSLAGNPKDGKIVDMIEFRERITQLVAPLESQYLNELQAVSAEVRRVPTCETLCLYFAEEINKLIRLDFLTQNPSLVLSSVAVEICDMNGVAVGAVKLSDPTP